MKTLKYKAYCLIEHIDDLNEIPSFEKSKREVIRSNRSFHGHPCDDPRKRGAVCEVHIIVRVPKMPPVSEQLREYVELFHGTPGLIFAGHEGWAYKRAKTKQRQELKRLQSVQ